ncbi:MAG: nuclear transport factor 2 family protein [Planctomycetota bacterium]|jgi:hypothetical protein
MRKTPADIVARQVHAYNERDVDAFTACYSPDILITDLVHGKIIASGAGELRRLYTNVVEKTQTLHCDVVGRITYDRVVIDREIVTGLPGNRELHAVAIYEVVESAIRRVWLIKTE